MFVRTFSLIAWLSLCLAVMTTCPGAGANVNLEKRRDDSSRSAGMFSPFCCAWGLSCALIQHLRHPRNSCDLHAGAARSVLHDYP